MTKTTITEALAELKTLGKRIDTKRATIQGFLTRREGLKDPLTKDGGSVEVIQREWQALTDLTIRQVAIRTAIQRCNQAVPITIEGVTKTIAEWLTWRKEVAPGEQYFLTKVRQTILTERLNVTKQGASVVEAGKEAKPTDLIINVDEGELAKQHEKLEIILGTLDGKLSLLNATTVFEV